MDNTIPVKANLRFLTKPQLINEVKSLRKEIKASNVKLEAMINSDREQQGVTPDSDTTSDATRSYTDLDTTSV